MTATRARSGGPATRPDGAHDVADINLIVAGYLRDLATLQSSTQKKWGYKRAAAAVLDLEDPLESLSRGGALPRIRHIGPASTRIVHEVLETGTSVTVEAAVEASDLRGEVMRRRALRRHFLSRAAAMAVLAQRSRTRIGLSDYRGDLQMHSVWSDGAESIESLIQGCLARGYTYCGITDHSYGLPIARGMSMEAVGRQHREIDRLNRLYDGRFRVIKSIEANIRGDGSLDLSADEVRRFELVLASPHSQLRTSADQTPRLLAVINTPGVHILGHPRGRMFDSRPGLAADWDAVFAAAARASVAVEIDGDRSRQDLDWTLARQALRAGCLLALDSDAHGSSELEMATWAVAHARLAGAPPDRVINTWTVDRLLTWAARQTAT